MTENNFLVSVALSTYNGSRYLSEQLDSVLSQSYINIELVILDDNSIDETSELLKSYESRYPNVRLFFSDINNGVLRSFEKVISYCKGHYILLCDQDDIWAHNKIEILLQNIGDFSLIYSDGLMIDSNGKLIHNKIRNIHLFGLDNATRDLNKYLLFNSFILGCSMMFSRNLLAINKTRFIQSSRNHDWFVSFLAANDKGIKFCSDNLFSYRIHDSNYSIRNFEESRMKLVLRYFSKEQIIKRRMRFLETHDVLVEILKLDIGLRDRTFVINSLDYYSSCLKGNFKLISLRYILMNYRYILPGTSKGVLLFFLLLHLMDSIFLFRKHN